MNISHLYFLLLTQVIFFETLIYLFIVLTHGKFDQVPTDPLPWFYSVAIASGLGLLVFSWLLLAIYYRHSFCKYDLMRHFPFFLILILHY